VRLNHELIRNLLLLFEEIKYESCMLVEDHLNSDFISKYSKDEVMYHVSQMSMADLIVADLRVEDSITVFDLTPRGHEFMENIRNDKMWNNTKKIASKIGSRSLTSLENIASQIVVQLIKQQMNLS